MAAIIALRQFVILSPHASQRTHRLLSDDVKFKDLGLLVVDEEQRFGVADKEAVKKLRADIDVLTLSATPIPRTLEMSLTGIRDLTMMAMLDFITIVFRCASAIPSLLLDFQRFFRYLPLE